MKKRLVLLALGLLLIVGRAQAQTLNGQVPSLDPCALYPHSWATVPLGTPTSSLVTGSTSQAIYVCAVHFATLATVASPAPLTLSYGIALATGTATPCASASPGNAMLFGAGAANGTYNIGTGNNTIFSVPTSNPLATANPLNTALPVTTDLCGLVSMPGVTSASIEYVKVKPLGQ